MDDEIDSMHLRQRDGYIAAGFDEFAKAGGIGNLRAARRRQGEVRRVADGTAKHNALVDQAAAERLTHVPQTIGEALHDDAGRRRRQAAIADEEGRKRGCDRTKQADQPTEEVVLRAFVPEWARASADRGSPRGQRRCRSKGFRSS